MKSNVFCSGTIEVKAGSLSFKADNILKSLQVPAEKADIFLLDMIKTMGQKCISICEPRAGYTVYDNPVFVQESGILKINNAHFSLGKIVANALKKSTKVAFFICTLGDNIEQLSKQFIREGHALEGFIVDLIGSELTEEVADITHKTIGTDMKKNNLNITNRYSPGYCNWPVSDQQHLFSLMENTFGVELKPSSLMIPMKSVSGVVGIGPDVRFTGYTCSKCDVQFCIYRDKK
jgi:hypothetical protein